MRGKMEVRVRVLFSPDVFVRQRFGGVSRYFAELHTGLTKAGVDARVFAGLHDNQYIARRGRTGLRRLPLGPRLLLSNGAFAAYSMAQRKASVVHPTYYTAGMIRGSRPHVCTFYDLIHLRYPGHFAASDRTVDRQRFWARRAQKIIAISKATADDLVCLLGVPSDKITVVHLGVHMPDVVATKSAPRDYLLYVGGRDGYKNWRIVVDALRSPELAALRLVCSGGGAPTKKEKALLEDRGLAHRVEFVQADEEALSRLYETAVALVYPSLYEGFGLPPLEAMARGVPVAAARAASIPEVLGDAALLFDPHSLDELVHALGRMLDTSTREELTRRGLTRARMFPWSKTTQQTIEVYREVLS
ncbi:glycosyltransferase family 4 protein [Streptomyces sp. PSKA54]|uniref:Glycosyltransferase family 4 protein n=1 Tax=Streptomyces himalayensis subsp. aureolus TaxID=2758039 RepID=A0A7W2CXI4_9ACTN|nr:glycosyltransferase family 1 protein [Streptomyces himalayensis]MBA4860952.1 glycosyltransferase family 4 protein [Streptomyces himalayensis subsp. aureolus]